ncbi:MAG: hypothetical protein IJV91_11155 [Kiritimatiellae bacterium]|nr:hypothetical protein [Kiritimatiellia bacterium]
MPSYELLTAKVVYRAARRKLIHTCVEKNRYYERDQYGTTSYFGTYRSAREAKTCWVADLRSRGLVV